MSLTARDLNAALWAAADEMRSVMSADVYKDYLLGLVFFPTKSLSKPMSCLTMQSLKVLKLLNKPMKKPVLTKRHGVISRPN